MSRSPALAWKGFGLLMLILGTEGAAFAPGDVYDGEVIKISPDAVEINITPCAKEQQRIIVRHYHITQRGDVTCPGKDGRTYKKVHVEEEDPNKPAPRPPAPPPDAAPPQTL